MAKLEARTLASGVGRSEGPVIRADGEMIVTSMDHGKLYRVDRGRAEVFSDVGHCPNGATEWTDGTLYVTQTGAKRFGPGAGTGGIQIVKRDGSWTWLTKDPIAPNDLCFGPDGFLYFTDPTRPREVRDDGRLFRADVKTGETELLCSLPWYPNGIGFGPEDDALYVMNSLHRSIERFPLQNGRLGKHERYVQQSPTHRGDGFQFDVDGNIVIGCNSLCDERGQIQTYDRNGKLLDAFVPGPGKMCTNVAINSAGFMIITATDIDQVLAVDKWPKAGLPLHPFR